MAINTNDLVQSISDHVYTNNTREITAERLAEVLYEIVTGFDTTNTDFAGNETVATLRTNESPDLSAVFIRDVGKYGMFIKATPAGRTDDAGVTCIKDAIGNEWVRIQDPYAGLTTPVLNALNAKVDKTTTVAGKALSSNVTLVKGDVGLGNVDNTSDLNKPVSTAAAAVHASLSASIATKQNNIVAGTTSQYYRGDKTFVTFPTIPSTTNELINNSGFITSSSINTLTNKTGNISMWNNDSGYVTISQVSSSFILPIVTTSNIMTLPSSSLFKTNNVSASNIPVAGQYTAGLQFLLNDNVLNKRIIIWGDTDLYKKYTNSGVSSSYYKFLDEQNYSSLLNPVYVSLSGDQPIDGIKTFNANTVHVGNNIISGSLIGLGQSNLTGNVNQLNGSAHFLYNTSDLTNYERLTTAWNSNQINIFSAYSGTGTNRSLSLGVGTAAGATSPGRYLLINPAGVAFTFTASLGTNTGYPFIQVYPSTANTSGINNLFDIVPTISQSSTAGYTALRVSTYTTASGSGAKLLLDVGTNSAASGSGTHTSYLKVDNTGVTTIGGTLLPSSNNTITIGQSGTIFNAVFTALVNKGASGNSFNLGVTGGTDVYLRSQPTTHNVVVQQAGAAPTETNYRFTVDGTGATSGSLLVTNGISQFNGTVRANQFRLSALNTAPSSATDTGTLGEIRVDANYIYVCTATNTWVRSALTTW